MNDPDAVVFAALFKEACSKCFGHAITDPLSETESKLFSGKILDQTGLVIGPKSIKNYSFFVFSGTVGKAENPSVATLDTLARYVLNAPYTNEPERKNKESHFPYWFQYKDRFHQSLNGQRKKSRWLPAMIIFICVMVPAGMAITLFPSREKNESFTESFQSTVDDSLINRGWFVQLKDTAWWNRRGEKAGYLSLFTLKGDSWPDSSVVPGIKNLLLRRISGDCFTAEIRLSEFIPAQNWQQAGILLLEDTAFTGKSMRVSFAYNNFFGGFRQKPEIIIQAITSRGKDSKPEEFFHKSLFIFDQQPDTLVINNMKKSAIRIEKRGKKFRLLFSSGPVENFAFREGTSQEFDMKPNYIGLFALKGQVDSSAIMPARFNFFRFINDKCN